MLRYSACLCFICEYLCFFLCVVVVFFFFFKQKTAYEMRISDWSSDVCSSDLTLGFEIALNPDPTRGLSSSLALGIERAAKAGADAALVALADKIGRASCRERVCQYV